MSTRVRLKRFCARTLAGSCVLVVLATAMFVGAWIAWPLPEDFLHPGPPGGLVVDSESGVLLDVVGLDEQRRLPISLADAGPYLPNAVIAAEDTSFRDHQGIDPGAVLSSLWANLRAGRTVRGASTITMQVVGLRLKNPRTYPGKAVEAFRALQLEARHDKDEILEAWLNSAPFGANLVGVEAASRAWLAKAASECTLSEAALLAALPNSPERLRPDRFPEEACARRDLILKRMLMAGVITDQEHAQAVSDVVLIRDRKAYANDQHVGWLALERGARGRVLRTTIEPEVQAILTEATREHARELPKESDIAIVLVDLEESSIVGLIGSSWYHDPRDGQVNGAMARRSPGSALKPFVYAAAFESHRLAPDSIVSDDPIELAGWRPRNIDDAFLGPITAAEALRESRNTPALRVARELGLAHVVTTMRRCGIELSLEQREAAGLSLVVGGAEVRLIELAEAYGTLARGGIHRPLRLFEHDLAPERRVLSRATCTAIEAALVRTESDFEEGLPFLAAKTGTSSGLRDAVAAGWNGRYAGVVWVGRFDGSGDPAYVGAEAALPLLRSILCHPSLSTGRPARQTSVWTVRNQVAAPLPPRTLAILEPRDGDRLVAFDGRARFRPIIKAEDGAPILLLDGAPVSDTVLHVGIGHHELRLLQPGMTPHVIEFEVLDRQ